jgi:hypothetical protein
MLADPFPLLPCCLVSDGGSAAILVSAEPSRIFPTRPVCIHGIGESLADQRPRQKSRSWRSFAIS